MLPLGGPVMWISADRSSATVTLKRSAGSAEVAAQAGLTVSLNDPLATDVPATIWS